MSKSPIPLHIADLSPFTRTLSRQLSGQDGVPSHLSLMNMLARAGGFRNVQHLRAVQGARGGMDAAADPKQVARLLNQFDAAGCLIRWPARRNVQEDCLWVLWSRLPAGRVMQERDVNAALNAAHHFGDAALIRRSLIGMGLLRRNADGSDYQRIEKRPSPQVRDVIAQLKARMAR
ncbi:hypothetical protein FHS89_000027 [Rubricella aquisinus]|uniref:DUF2087 domain-containing protein n=1 Tax=Rubricella aquisinus TaxID=2028108 RepID=A0A840WFU3_9RHOB|nr:DUF2087 domain-containing protein [Rubricella aquisinus]MBB5514029.1 hypothetical protein [Rubricella aquisinus]